MSHNLTETDHMFSGNDQVPWHGLGTVIEGLATAKEAIEFAKLDWQVTKEPAYQLINGVYMPAKDCFLCVRSDNNAILGQVGKQYTPMQNVKLAELAEMTVKQGAAFETAGSLFGGEIVWFLLRADKTVLTNGEEHKTYLLMSMGHGGKQAIKAYMVDVRVVCWNTFSAALGEGERLFYVKHTPNSEAKVQDKLFVLSKMQERQTEIFKRYEQMMAASITVDAANKLLLEKVVTGEGKRSENIRDEIMELFRNGRGNTGSNRYDLFNAVTDYVDHSRGTRVTEGSNAGELRMASSLFTSGAAMKNEAFTALISA